MDALDDDIIHNNLQHNSFSLLKFKFAIPVLFYVALSSSPSDCLSLSFSSSLSLSFTVSDSVLTVCITAHDSHLAHILPHFLCYSLGQDKH